MIRTASNALFACAMIWRFLPSAAYAAEKPLSEMLLSVDAEERERALATALSRPRLFAGELRALVQAQRFMRLPDRIRDNKFVFGPVTTDTAVTRALLRHGDAAFPFLIVGLRDDDYNVRRYSAFCLGRLCRRQALPELRRSLEAEIPKAQTMSAADASGQEGPFISVLAAMAEAAVRIDAPGTVEWMLGWFVSGRKDFRNLALNAVLTQVLAETPGGPWNASDEWTDARAPEWRQWWASKAERRPLDSAFRIALCPGAQKREHRSLPKGMNDCPH